MKRVSTPISIIIIAFACLYLSNVFAGPLDTLAPGQWYEFPNSKLNAVNPCPSNNCSYSGVEGQTAVMDDWSGGAYDTTRDQLMVWGGGHGGYGGNEVYAFNLTTGTWSRLTEPSNPITLCAAYYPDGRPASSHTYNQLQYLPTLDGFATFGLGHFCQSGGGAYPDTVILNLTSKQWSKLAARPDQADEQEYGTFSALDANGNLWVHTGEGGRRFHRYNIASNTWTTYNSAAIYYASQGATAAIDTVRNRFVAIGESGGYPNNLFARYWDLNNPNNASVALTGVSTSWAGSGAPGMVYDPIGDRFLLWNGGATVHTLDAATLAKWGTVAINSGNSVTPTAANTRGTYGRFRYVPSKHGLVVVNRTDENVYFFKLPGSGATPAPTVSLTATPTSIDSGSASTLTWSSSQATSCTASGAWNGSRTTSGSESTGALTTSSTYTLSCTGVGGTTSRSVTVSVNAPALPTVSLTANPTNVSIGGSSTLTWSTTNATTCTASGVWSGTRSTAGTEVLTNLATTGTYTLTCNGTGGSATASATITVSTSSAPTLILTANPTTVVSGGSTTLSWTSTGTNLCWGSNVWKGRKPLSGSQTIPNLTATTRFTLTCRGVDGSTIKKSVTVTVSSVLAPTVTLTANPTTLASGSSTTISWSSTNATSCNASGAWSGSRATAGVETLPAITTSSTFTLTCTGSAGSAAKSVTVTVTSATPAPTVTLSANPASVASGATSGLSWSSTNATSCTASGAWSGSKPTSGNQTTQSITVTSTFTLVCTGAGGTASDSTTVNVNAEPSSDIATVTLSNTGAVQQVNGVVTFGHYFKMGDVPSDRTVIAKRADGSLVTLQVDVKARHSDNSLKHAVLTALVPSLNGASSEKLTLSASVSAGNGTPITVSDVLASSFDAQVNLNINGTVYTSSARTLLQGSTLQSWLSGPLVSEWIVGSPIKNNGISHPHLATYYHVRAYGKPVTRVRVDTVVENGWTFKSGATAFNYVPSVSVGSNVIYNNNGASLNHYHHSRWHIVGWWGGDPKIVGLPNGQYLKASQATPNYGVLTLQDSVYSGYAQTSIPMKNANLRVNWGDTGYDRQIGPLPEWDAAYVVGGDLRAYNAVLANAAAGGAYSYHYRDESTGTLPKIESYPALSEQGWEGGLVQGTGGNVYSHEPGADPSAHQPLLGYLAYVITGDYFYLEELQFLANYNLIWAPSYGNRAQRIVGLQNRGRAWGLRTLGHAAALTPTDHPLKTYLNNETLYNITSFTNEYATAGGKNYNNLGGVQDYNWPYGGAYSPWQNDFFVIAYGQLVDLGFTQAQTMRNWLAKFPVGRLGGIDGNSGMCWYYATQYALGAGISNGRGQPPPYVYYNNFTEFYQANFPTESQQPCPTSGLMSSSAYPTEATAYYANLRAALAYAIDAKVGSSAMWDKVKTMGTPNYTNAPVWNIVPR